MCSQIYVELLFAVSVYYDFIKYMCACGATARLYPDVSGHIFRSFAGCTLVMMLILSLFYPQAADLTVVKTADLFKT